jgi:DNA-binding MarR family transcriptional regulator
VEAVLDGLMALSRAVVAVTARSLTEVGADVSLSQYRALIVLASRGPQRVADLASELKVLPSTVTRLCDRLLTRGLVTRQPSDTDRRVVWVALSQFGKELVAQAMNKRRELLAELVTAQSFHGPQAFARDAERLAVSAGELPESQWWQHWERSTLPPTADHAV